MKEFYMVHSTILAQTKEKRKKSVIGCAQCGVTVDTKPKLRRHMESQHPFCKDSSSSEQSPPRKKAVKLVEVKNVQDQGVDIIDEMELDTSDCTQDIPDTTIKDDLIKNQGDLVKNQAKDIKRLEI